MFEKSLDNIAERILTLDEESMNNLWEKYKKRMEKFDTSKEWEKAVIIFFIINAVRVKNKIFNEQVTQNATKSNSPRKPARDIPYLKRIK
ncbi:MAG: hypothetical protein M0P57_12000 [Syntrophales bacterium]|jgi:DNA-binding ferritin-like protein|nr:hypothetical protein [Syntrophales bacterium]MDY0043522.1 hypothetical protein [Syntrophales bacterium]